MAGQIMRRDFPMTMLVLGTLALVLVLSNALTQIHRAQAARAHLAKSWIQEKPPVEWTTYPLKQLRSPITRAACDKIRKGMAPGEVDAIMGCPQGYYCAGEPFSRRKGGRMTLPPFDEASSGFVETWENDSACINVGFLHGKVVYAHFSRWPPAPKNWFGF